MENISFTQAMQTKPQTTPQTTPPQITTTNQPSDTQTHVHEFLGSTKLAEECDERHNHRFAGVTSQVIPQPDGSHIHGLFTNTDFFDHLHEITVLTESNIDVGGGKHVHFAQGTTTLDDGHVHDFVFATLIDSPLTDC